MRRHKTTVCLWSTLLLTSISCSKPAGQGSTESATKTASSNPSAESSSSVAAPRAGVSFTASPNPVEAVGPLKVGITALTWKTTGQKVEVHVGSPNGVLFTVGSGSGSATTGNWVKDGTIFFLQDGAAVNPQSPEATLATLRVAVK